MISSLPPAIIRTRPGLSGRSGITNASREMPSASVIAKIRSISLSVIALSKLSPRVRTALFAAIQALYIRRGQLKLNTE
jgi:hypothetical protein